MAIQANGARRGIVKPLDEGHNSALSAPAGPNKSDRLARLNGDRNALEHVFVGEALVGKVDVIKL
jgi:hypothetical protein